VRLGYEVRYDYTSIIIDDPSLPAISGAANVFSLRCLHNAQDSATLPRNGVQFSVRGN
jgi:hypothetical protein